MSLVSCMFCEDGTFIPVTKSVDPIYEDWGLKVRDQRFKQCDNCETVIADAEDLEFNAKQKHYYKVRLMLE